jgi:hypothetical protein
LRGRLLIAALLAAASFPAAAASAAPAASASHPEIVANSVLTAPNPRAAYDALDRRDRAAFDSVELPATTSTTIRVQGIGANAGKTLTPPRAARLLQHDTPGSKVSVAYSGCWAMQTTGWSQSRFLHKTLYRYGQSTEVCVSRGRVTKIYVYNVWDETSTPGWRTVKDAKTAAFNVGWEGRGRAQYYFVLGVGGWDIQHPTTCLQLRLNGNGYNYALNGSCSLS